MENRRCEMAEISWEEVENNYHPQGQDKMRVYRAKVPNGWLVSILWTRKTVIVHDQLTPYSGLTFVPDPNHEWQ
jgi:hypothetical protein